MPSDHGHPPPPSPGDGDATWAHLDHLLAPLQWDWSGWLPRGFLTILASEPGVGKSLLCLHLAATYLEGRPWPDGTPFTAGPGRVIWCESEAGHALNLERARRWRLDLTQILSPLDNPLHNFKLDDPDHHTALLNLARRDDVRLVVLDSLRGLRSPGRHAVPLGHLLLWLSDIARIAARPVLLTHHLRKRAAHDAGGALTLDHLLGASAIAQSARVVWTLDAPDPADPDHRRLSVIKNNLARAPGPLGVRVDARGLHFGPPPQTPTRHTELDRAVAFLRGLLAAGALPFNQIQARSQAAGFSLPTIRRAKKQLAVASRRRPGETEWYWELPGGK